MASYYREDLLHDAVAEVSYLVGAEDALRDQFDVLAVHVVEEAAAAAHDERRDVDLDAVKLSRGE